MLENFGWIEDSAYWICAQVSGSLEGLNSLGAMYGHLLLFGMGSSLFGSVLLSFLIVVKEMKSCGWNMQFDF